MAEITTQEFSKYFGRFVTLDIRFYKKEEIEDKKTGNKFTKVTEEKEKRLTYKHNNENNVRIAFDVQKYPNADNKGAGTAHIKIYNLSDNDMQLINKIGNNEFVKLRLTAGNGSEENEQLIFDGSLNTPYVRYVNTDLIQHLWGFSYDEEVETASPVEKNYSDKTLRAILNDYLPLVNLKLNTGNLSEKAKERLNTEKISSMNIKDVYELQKKASEILNAKIYIDDGKFKIVSMDVNLYDKKLYPDDSFKHINRETGLIQSPTVLNVGLEVNMLLRGDIQMFDKTFVESPYADYNLTSAQFTDVTKKIDARYDYTEYKGFFNKGFAYYISHQGDTHENLWKTTIRTITNQEE